MSFNCCYQYSWHFSTSAWVCALWSGEPCIDSVSVGHSEAGCSQGPCLYHCTVFGGLFRSRGPLFGPATQNHSGPLCQQGQLSGYQWITSCGLRDVTSFHNFDLLFLLLFFLAQVPIELNAAQALGIEVLCTFQMVFTVFSVEDQRRRESPEPGNLAIGLAHSTGVLIGVRWALFCHHFINLILSRISFLELKSPQIECWIFKLYP